MRNTAPTQQRTPLLIVLLLMLCACASGSASEPITVQEAWARAIPSQDGTAAHSGTHGDSASGNGAPGSTTSAAYMLVRNHTSADDRFLSADADFATVELHQTTIADGIARMAQVTDGLVVPAQGSVALEPGSYHLMLIDIERSLNAGDTFDLTLTFENAGDIPVSVTVRDP